MSARHVADLVQKVLPFECILRRHGEAWEAWEGQERDLGSYLGGAQRAWRSIIREMEKSVEERHMTDFREHDLVLTRLTMLQ